LVIEKPVPVEKVDVTVVDVKSDTVDVWDDAGKPAIQLKKVLPNVAI